MSDLPVRRNKAGYDITLSVPKIQKKKSEKIWIDPDTKETFTHKEALDLIKEYPEYDNLLMDLSEYNQIIRSKKSD